jgi:hypothetical protein
MPAAKNDAHEAGAKLKRKEHQRDRSHEASTGGGDHAH